jgi:hypothetical protein
MAENHGHEKLWHIIIIECSDRQNRNPENPNQKAGYQQFVIGFGSKHCRPALNKG